MRVIILLLLFPILQVMILFAKEKSGETDQGHLLVPKLQKEIQPILDKNLAKPQAKALQQLVTGRDIPARFKLPVRVKALDDPWAGMAELEKQGFDLAQAAGKGPPGILEILNTSSLMLGELNIQVAKVRVEKPANLEEHVRHLIGLLSQVRDRQKKALEKLTVEEQAFLFGHPATMVPHFGPQLSYNDRTKDLLRKDQLFCKSMVEKCDWSEFVGSAKDLTVLADPSYLAALQKILAKMDPIKDTVPGVTGDILFKQETPHGLILFGGKGANTYDLKVPIALLVDLGGDDHYKGVIASCFDASHANSVVIDLAGNDVYEGNEFGLATGRLGVGLLVDLAGNDTYKLAQGSGGAGFGGIGILCDLAGNDKYEGSRFTQGAGIAGIGLLLDLNGDDQYTSFGYALGIGGPAGVGAVIDVAGNDSYQCGMKYGSGYNASDAPHAKPGDPNYQYDAFGMAIGLGRRIYPRNEESNLFALAGGVGMILDLAGDDKYDSSNFSQACGYFFGIGLKIDLKGNDTHKAERYGHAAGAHYGMGLFADYQGKDKYLMVGPTYNGGCAWDHSAFLFLDGGEEDDDYDISQSNGLGRADIGSWAVFADWGGKDRYSGSGLGQVTDNSLAVFFDRAGEDDYQKASGGKNKPGNGKTLSDPAGGLFLDR